MRRWLCSGIAMRGSREFGLYLGRSYLYGATENSYLQAPVRLVLRAELRGSLIVNLNVSLWGSVDDLCVDKFYSSREDWRSSILMRTGSLEP